jgi:two-component system C4-dicarboxylate transport response regulator DctD
VAATKVDLNELSRKGQFRPDLFYRLNVAGVRIPSLVERRDDVLPLFHGFLQQAGLRFQIVPPPLTTDAQQALLLHSWPGNVRELQSCADRMALGLPLLADGKEQAAQHRSFDETVAMVERSLIEESLRRHGGSVKDTCTELSMTSATMYRKLKALGIEASSFRASGDDEAASR